MPEQTEHSLFRNETESLQLCQIYYRLSERHSLQMSQVLQNELCLPVQGAEIRLMQTFLMLSCSLSSQFPKVWRSHCLGVQESREQKLPEHHRHPGTNKF